MRSRPSASTTHDADHGVHGFRMKRRQCHSADPARSRTVSRRFLAQAARAGMILGRTQRVRHHAAIAQAMEQRPAVAQFDAAQDVRVMTHDDVGAGIERRLGQWPFVGRQLRRRVHDALVQGDAPAGPRRARGGDIRAQALQRLGGGAPPVASGGVHRPAVAGLHPQEIAARAIGSRPGGFRTHAVVAQQAHALPPRRSMSAGRDAAARFAPAPVCAMPSALQPVERYRRCPAAPQSAMWLPRQRHRHRRRRAPVRRGCRDPRRAPARRPPVPSRAGYAALPGGRWPGRPMRSAGAMPDSQ